jgi:hypothetical protein
MRGTRGVPKWVADHARMVSRMDPYKSELSAQLTQVKRTRVISASLTAVVGRTPLLARNIRSFVPCAMRRWHDPTALR